eukprot:871476_1
MGVSFLCFHLTFILSFSRPTISSWVISDSQLPRSSHSMIIGSYQHDIYLLGGGVWAMQFVTYDTKTYQFTDNGTDALTDKIWSTRAQTYTQINDTIYFVNGESQYVDTQSAFARYNMRTHNINTSTDQSIWNYDGSIAGDDVCVTSTSRYLFALGEYELHVLDLSTSQWLLNTSSMNER